MRRTILLSLILSGFMLVSNAQLNLSRSNERESHQSSRRVETKQFFKNSEKSQTRAIECMPEATYSNAPTDFYSGVNSNTDIGYRVAQRIVGFDNPIEAIRIFGVQMYFNGLEWVVVNDVDPLNFEFKFYEDDDGYPGNELEEFNQTASLKHHATGDVFDFDFFVFHWDFILDSPIMGLPEIFWVSAANTDDNAWFMWLDQPGGLDIAMQLEEISGNWSPNIYPAGICLVPNLSEPGSPAKPEDLVVNVADLGELAATVSWTNPNKTFDGNNLTELTKITLEVNGLVEEVYNNPLIGGTLSYTFVPSESGLYKFSVYGTNSEGDGPAVSQIVWIGHDVPGAPQNVTLTAIADGGLIEWEAPTTGLHNGYIDASQTTYTVIRLPNTVVAEGISETQVTDIFNPNIGEYQYNVSALNAIGAGGSAGSNFAVLGGEGVLLYETFKSVTVGDLPMGWVIENEQGGWAVQKTKFAGGESPEMQLFWEPPFFGKSRLATHSIDVDGHDDLRWSFLHRFDLFAMVGSCDLAAQVSFDGGAWQNVWSKTATSSITSEVLELIIEVPENATQMRLGWEFDGNVFDIDAWYIDNVIVEPIMENDLRALSISGDQTPEVGQAGYYSVTIENIGSLSQTSYTVKLMKEGGIELGSAIGVAINPDETKTFDFTWTPEAADEGKNSLYGEVVLEGDENIRNNKTTNFNVVVQPVGVAIITIGTGNITPEYIRVPFDFYWMNSLSQTIYYAEEIGLGSGVLTSIAYTNSFTSNLLDKSIRIWVGETTEDDLSEGWVPFTDLTLVFDGTVDFPSGKNSIIIPLDNPYIYGGGNLVVYTNRVWEENFGLMVDNFMCSEDYDSQRTLFQFADGATPMDPANPGEFYMTDYFPNAKLFFNTDGLGTLSGIVSHATEPIEGAEVKILGTTLKAVTNVNGEYLFPYVMPGNWDISYEAFGYHPTLENVVIEPDETTVQNIQLNPISQYTVKGSVKGNDNVMLSGATVKLKGYDHYSVSTNSNGEFTVAGVYEGVYVMTISADGYTSHIQEGIEVNDVQVEEGVISLGEYTLNELIVAPHGLSVFLNPDNVSDVLFSWQHNINGSGSKTFNGFNVYLDDVLVTENPIMAMEYNFQALDLNVQYKASVQSVYNTESSEKVHLTFTTLKPSKVSGTVKNVLGVLPGAKVTLGDRETTTDGNGKFEFTQVFVNQYTLTISSQGYETHSQPVNVVGNDLDLGEIVLNETIVTPYGLLIEMQQDANKVKFSWNNAFGFEDDFESYDDFIIDNIGDYTLYDGDGSSTYGFDQATFPNSQYVGSYIIFNPSTTTPPIGSPDIVPHSGAKYIACFSAVNGPNNDWLITPMVGATPGMKFSFWAKTYMPDYGLERFKVAVSTTDTNVESFTFITDQFVQVSPLWSKYEYDLSDFAGQDIHIALVCVSDQAFILMVDDMAVSVDMKSNPQVLAHTMPTISQLANGQGTRAVTGYNVYLNNELVAETPVLQEEFMFTNLLPNTGYVAGVQGVFETAVSDIVEILFTTGDASGVSEGLLTNLRAYPNPFGSSITVEQAHLVNRVVITNALGQKVMEKVMNGDEIINTAELSEGLYLITFEGFDGERVVRKMIKQ